MSDTQNKDPRLPPKASDEDDDIIDLVDEIDEEGAGHPLSALERNLLDLDDKGKEASGALAELPDIADLSRIDFEEEEDEEKIPEESPAFPEVGAEVAGATGDAAGLFGPDAELEADATGKQPTGGGLDEIEEISEFDQQFLDAEEILESLPDLPEGATSDEAEDIELLEVEEDDADDEIVWFDDLAKPDQEAPVAQPTPEAVSAEPPTLEPEPEPIQDTSAADVFAAHVESARADAGTGARLSAAARRQDAGNALAADIAAFQAPIESAPAVQPPFAADASPAAAPGLTPEEIEAAVERVMARKLGGTIEAIILQAIEKAVSKEIERLKSLLLDDEAGDRTP
ncbi:MAG: hypothetical protein ACM3KE_07830 [Hyphomicrobiales bacterium]